MAGAVVIGAFTRTSTGGMRCGHVPVGHARMCGRLIATVMPDTPAAGTIRVQCPRCKTMHLWELS